MQGGKMLTISEQQALREFGETLEERFKEAIRNKPIQRRTPSQGSFSAPVNASGRLAESARTQLEEGNLNLYALDYVWYLVFGRPPTRNMGSGDVLPAISQWLQDKNLPFSPYAVTSNIHKYGTSIWQEHQGKDSGLLEDLLTDADISELGDKLLSLKEIEIKSRMMEAFAA
jgi:hypothetical protein